MQVRVRCKVGWNVVCTCGSSGAGGFLLLLLQQIFQKLGILRSQSLRFSPANGFDQNILYHQADLPLDLREDKRFSTIFIDSWDKKPFINFYVKSIKNNYFNSYLLHAQSIPGIILEGRKTFIFSVLMALKILKVTLVKTLK